MSLLSGDRQCQGKTKLEEKFGFPLTRGAISPFPNLIRYDNPTLGRFVLSGSNYLLG
jgi:hypothetical protein